MTWRKGQSGNPGGRSRRDKLISEQIILALKENDPETKTQKVRLLARALVDRAIAGDVQAAREIMDRVEGKAIQVNENHNFGESVRDLTDEQLKAILVRRFRRRSADRGQRNRSGFWKAETTADCGKIG